MNYVIHFENKIPAYMQLYSYIKADIQEGTFPYGTKIPSKRLLSEDTGLSLITVEHALDLLVSEGYIEPKERSGYFVSYRKNEFFKDTVTSGLPVVSIKPVAQQEEAFPFSSYAKAARKVLNDYGERLLIDSGPTGAVELQTALANYLARFRGIHVSPHQIYISSGSEYSYSLIIQAFGRNRIYGLEHPCYKKIEQTYRNNEVRIDYLKMGGNGILTGELERTPASILHVTAYNSYPSGISADASKRQEYISWALKRDALIIEDDYDSEFSSLKKTEDTLFSLEPTHSVIYLNTFSVTISKSVRLAYMVVPKQRLSLFQEKTGMNRCPVSVFQQLIVAELLNNGEFERHVNRIRRKRRKEHD